MLPWARVVTWLLLLVHAGLGLWAAVGVAELALEQVPWNRVSNPAFSIRMLALHWTLIGAASVTFIAGYFSRWPPTPWAMAGIYGAMAATCAYQTFFVLTSPSRYWAMAIEYVEYGAISLFLFRASAMRAHFSQ